METTTAAPAYGMTKRLPGVGFDQAVSRVTDALEAEGFGVLTEIDVRETLKKKLGVDFPRYVILGACNAALAHRALAADPYIGLLLPCNVVVMESGVGTTVSIADPLAMFRIVENAGVAPIAESAKGKLKRALELL